MQMKKMSFFTVLLSGIIITSSCSLEDDSDYYDSSLSQVSSGTIVSDAASNALLIKLDEYPGIAYPEGGIPETADYYKWKVGDRVVFNFYFTDKEITGTHAYNYKIKIAWIGLITTRNPVIISSAAQDTLGTDPFFESNQHINSLFIIDNFLNINPYFFYFDYKKHSVSLASYYPEEYRNANDTINFELKHNAHKDDQQTLTPTSIFSFRLDDLKARMEKGGKNSVVLAIKIPIVTQRNLLFTEYYRTQYINYKI
jgi:hypothetical protein